MRKFKLKSDQIEFLKKMYPDNLRCGKPEVEDGSEKMWMLMQSEEVHKIISIIIG